jgi:hypothetical protein
MIKLYCEDLNHAINAPRLKGFSLNRRIFRRQKNWFRVSETKIPVFVKKATKMLPGYTFGLNARREYRHVAMALRAMKLKNVETIFVFEIFNQHLFFSMPLLLLSGHKILIGLHGNQQLAVGSRVKYLGLLYLKQFLRLFSQIKVLLFETDDDVLPERFRMPKASKIIVPHPILGELVPKLKPGERLSEAEKIKNWCRGYYT